MKIKGKNNITYAYRFTMNKASIITETVEAFSKGKKEIIFDKEAQRYNIVDKERMK